MDWKIYSIVVFFSYASYSQVCSDVFSGSFVSKQSSPWLESEKLSAPAVHQTRLRSKITSSGSKNPYERIYIGGAKEVDVALQMALELRKGSIDPFKTHIVYFENQIPYFIRYMKQGIERLDSSKSKKQALLEQLSDMEKSAKTAVKNKQVTYSWWLDFVFYLTRILSNKRERLDSEIPYTHYAYHHHGIKMIQELISKFPDKIFIPMITSDNRILGVMPINKALAQNVHFLQVFNKPMNADGVMEYPHEFFQHDINHARLAQPANHYWKNLKHLMDQADFLTVDQRKKAEFFYFLVGFETGFDYPSLANYQSMYEDFLLDLKHNVNIEKIFPLVRNSSHTQNWIEELEDGLNILIQLEK